GFEADLVGAAASSGAGGGLQYRPIAQDDLVVPGPTGVYEGKLATEVPSSANGSWTLNPDGSMDVTWRFRPNITWHDGTPFTAHDIRFGYEVRNDPAMPRLRGTR